MSFVEMLRKWTLLADSTLITLARLAPIQFSDHFHLMYVSTKIQLIILIKYKRFPLPVPRKSSGLATAKFREGKFSG